MTRPIEHPHQPPVHYDFARHRLWILGQRCHHGAVGAILAASAWAWIASDPTVAGRHDPTRQAHSASPAIMLAGAAGALMAHDWKDHALWFERGAGTQA
ncbi:MAG: hypothetical protein QOH12_2502 [Solirubrobacteraceae bacterium]|jgi:hypothetical protein|nr:hypothetical protein [Solirubrobacteraceae bacterium]